MSLIEPAYLRYIYDGLAKGSIHPGNAAELPNGLIGMYEEAFDERISVTERQKILQRFVIWALLKKEVSAVFVAEILGETEDSIQEFISTYSVWFNSPESGKYHLYHERFKVYLLQINSEEEIFNLNDKILYTCIHSLQEEVLSYSYQFLSLHFWLAHFIRPTDLRIKAHILDGAFTFKQFSFLNDFESVFANFEMGFRYFGQIKDNEFLLKLLKHLEFIKQLEYKVVEEINNKSIHDLDLSEIRKIKQFLFRQDQSGESYFKYAFNLLSEAIILHSNQELIDYMISDIRDYLETHDLEIDEHISFLALIFLIEFNQDISESLLFLVDYNRDFSMVSKFSTQTEIEEWIPFEDKIAFRQLKENHFKRIFKIKETHLTTEFFYRKFLLFWGELSKIQQHIAIQFINLQERRFLIEKIKIFIEQPNYFGLISLCCQNHKDLIQLLSKKFMELIQEGRISNRLKCLYISDALKKNKDFSFTKKVEDEFKNLFIISYYKIKSKTHRLQVILNLENSQIFQVLFDPKNITLDKTFLEFYRSNNTVGMKSYIQKLKIDFFPNFKLFDISDDFIFNCLIKNHDRVPQSEMNKAFWSKLKKNNVNHNNIDLSIFTSHQQKDFELIQVINDLNLKIEDDNIIVEKLASLSYGPHREIAILYYLIQNPTVDFEQLLKTVPIDLNRSKFILTNGIFLKQNKLLQTTRTLIIKDLNFIQSSLTSTIMFNEILDKGLSKFIKFIVSNLVYIFNKDSFMFDFIEKNKTVFTEKTFDSLFYSAQEIVDEFDYYLFIQKLFNWESTFCYNFKLSKWKRRITLIEDKYWRDSCYQELIEFLLKKGDLKNAKKLFYSKLDLEGFYNYPRICTWQKIVIFEIKNAVFEEALILFENQRIFPDPSYFPEEDEYKVEICLGFSEKIYMKNFVYFFKNKLRKESFQNAETFVDLLIVFDTIDGKKDFIDCLEHFINFPSIIKLEQVFDVILLVFGKQIVLHRLREIQNLSKRYFLINHLFSVLTKDDTINVSLFNWFVELPIFSNLTTLTRLYS